jgi:hypothetical protein
MKRTGKYLQILLFLAFTNLAGGKALAVEMSEYSSREKIGFAFYKLGNVEIKFKEWTKKTDKYQTLKPSLAKRFIEAEKERLWLGYNLYDPMIHPIKFKTYATIRRSPLSFDASAQMAKVFLSASKYDNRLHFPVEVGKYWVLIVPENVEKFERITIDKEKYNFLFYAPHDKESAASYTDVAINIIMIPSSVDAETPVFLNDELMWLMSAKIAQLTVMSADEELLIWEYKAPWYNPSEIRNKLYKYD